MKEMKLQVWHFLKYFLWGLVISLFCVLGFGTPLIETLASNPDKPYEMDYYIVDSVLLMAFFIGNFLLSFTIKNKAKFWGANVAFFVIILLAVFYFHVGRYL